METLVQRINELKDEVIELRRDIHMYPEIAFEEFRTSELVYDYLSMLNLDVRKGINKTGVVADLIVPDAKKNILFRADMDALPIQEEMMYHTNQKFKVKCMPVVMMLILLFSLLRQKYSVKSEIN